jgi:hypothetical protein
MESVVEALPDVLMNLPLFVHTGAKLGPCTCAEDDCSCTLAGEDMVPFFVVVATEATFFVCVGLYLVYDGKWCTKSYIWFLLCGNMTCGRSEFVECDVKGIPCY